MVNFVQNFEMKQLSFLAFLCSSLCFGQYYDEIRIKDENGTRLLKNATIDLDNNELNYLNPQENKSFVQLDNFQKIEYRKGSYWLTGLIGGLAGGFLVKATMKKPGEEIWYGAGPYMVLGGLAGAGLGAMMPKYKTIKKNDQTLTISFNTITYHF